MATFRRMPRRGAPRAPALAVDLLPGVVRDAVQADVEVPRDLRAGRREVRRRRSGAVSY